MLGARVFNFILFFVSLAVAFKSNSLLIETPVYLKALLIFWVFSSLYHHLRVLNKRGNTTVDYGISYSLSFAIFTGPLGLFIFETIYRFSVYFNKKRTKTDDPEEFYDTFYNIGSFVLSNSATFFLYQHVHTYFDSIPFGFWVLMFLLVCVNSLLIDIFLVTAFSLLGDIKSSREAWDFIKGRSVLDMGKTSFTNGLLLLFLLEEQWGMLISLFILNYLVSHSFYSKSQSIQDKFERDKFEQMAYTDFLTGVNNRAYMDKTMGELGHSREELGIVVADIDKFKRINDSYNHSVGDQVIQHFAKTLKSYLREEDYLFRSGGEEFTIFLRNRSFKCSQALVEQILQGVANHSVTVEFDGEMKKISYTSSFGLYFFKADDHVSIERGYIHADQLLLQSKQLGKNRVTSKNELNKVSAVHYH